MQPDAPERGAGGLGSSDARITTVGEGLRVPWDIVFPPGGGAIVTERPGTLAFLPSGDRVTVPNVEETSEGGLLGAALHPDFASNGLIYLYQTTADSDGLDNKIVRYRLSGRSLTTDRVILEGIRGARYHDGGRMAFGPDGYLYVTVGDATEPAESQDPGTLEGTILRMTTEGAPAPGNPFGNLVYSYGHRNPQGIAWDAAGRLWSNEHGPSGSRSGNDEINLIEAGGNYGWPDSVGDSVESGTIAPVVDSGSDTTWAPGGLAYFDGRLFMTGLRGSRLYEATLSGTEVIDWEEHFVDAFGRLRDITVGPDGFLYLTTSNRDGRGDPAEADDRVFRINPDRL
jgi:glucose/arabinose dehydrogenase